VFVGEHALRNIVTALIASPKFQIVGLFFRTPPGHSADKFNMYTIYSSYSEALCDESVECIYISSPNKYHFEHSRDALKNGKHVICEKPLASSYSQFLELMELSVAANRCIFEGFMFQYHNQFVELKNLVDNKKLGEVLTLSSRFGYPHLHIDNIRYKKNLHGGAFFDCACYLIKAVFLILGDGYESIRGDVTYQDGYEVDTGGVCLITYASGQVAFLDWGIGRSYSNEIDIWTDAYRVKAERIFSKSSTLDSSITHINSQGSVNLIEIDCMNHFDAMFNEFYEIINANRFGDYLLRLKMYQRFFFATYHSLFEKKYEKY
jgi:NDP-hexose-3-ketoreductase